MLIPRELKKNEKTARQVHNDFFETISRSSHQIFHSLAVIKTNSWKLTAFSK